MITSRPLRASLQAPAAAWQARISLLLRRLPMLLSLLLLAFQVIIPWTANHFATQDGPSHLYNALATRDVLLHPNSLYAGLYVIQSKLIPNWTTTLLLAAATTLAGPDHAEQLLASGVLLALYFAFAYACESVSSRASGYTPITNFLVQTWFLSVGFYNFQIGMAGGLFLIGFYLRRRSNWTPLQSGWMAAAMAVLFFTHIVPAALVCLTVGIIEGWLLLMEPRTGWRGHGRRIALLAIGLLPALLLIGAFQRGAEIGISFHPEAWDALENFPGKIFRLTSGRAGREELLYPVVLAYLAIGALAIRRREWRSVPGAILVTTLLIFALYLFVPDSAMGGGEVKNRFAWAVFLFGGLLSASIRSWKALLLPMSIYVAALLTVNLFTVMSVNARESSLVDAYVAAADVMPPGSRFVRLLYPIPATLARYRLNGISSVPQLHADAFVAARRGLLDLSDYEALSHQFPLRYRMPLSVAEEWRLWGLESAWVNPLDHFPPQPIDYVLVVGDAPNPDTLALMESHATLVRTAGEPPFLRVYRWQPPVR